MISRLRGFVVLLATERSLLEHLSFSHLFVLIELVQMCEVNYLVI